ncbi:hypothetical protein AVEN_268864-1 [Araneus ventricosus]|uniref:Uncharacterized protein n=1 Tax=Araneus ventricosus TaxID=182803 RepID=A0A4Y2EYI5_ARAVE|nr:hypothetical protein AVEN_268864-1 [Araneus ventricosus]
MNEIKRHGKKVSLSLRQKNGDSDFHSFIPKCSAKEDSPPIIKSLVPLPTGTVTMGSTLSGTCLFQNTSLAEMGDNAERRLNFYTPPHNSSLHEKVASLLKKSHDNETSS